MASILDLFTYHFAFLLLCLLVNEQGFAQNTDEDEEEVNPVSITYNISKNADFICTVKDLGGRQIIWRRLSDPYPISVSTSRFVPDRRYEVTGVGSNSVKLTINELATKDAGEYECRVSGQEGLVEIITLNIKGGPLRPYLKQTETVIKAAEGDTALLPCEVENLGGKRVLWRNEKNEVVTLRRRNYIGDRNFRIIHDTAPQWSLQIQKVQKSHYGYYTCVINSNPVLTRTVLLKQMVAPEFAPTLIMNSAYQLEKQAKAGEAFTVQCDFRANPPAKVNWYRRYTENGEDKKEDLGEGNRVVVRAARPDQSGTYFCVGKNGLLPHGRGRTRVIITEPSTTAPPITTTVMMDPTGPVSPQMYHMGNQLSVSRGSDTTLTCTAVAQPRAYVHWYRHGTRLSNNHKYDIESKSFGRFKTTSTLLIRGLNSLDFGEYNCHGYNQLGIKIMDYNITKAD